MYCHATYNLRSPSDIAKYHQFCELINEILFDKFKIVNTVLGFAATATHYSESDTGSTSNALAYFNALEKDIDAYVLEKIKHFIICRIIQKISC